MLINKLNYLLLFFVGVVFAQEKKVDTVFVYEEIIVHDTVYIEKPLEKMVVKKVEIIPDKKKSLLKLYLPDKQITLIVDSLIIKKRIKKTHFENKFSGWVFGGKTGFGTVSNSLFQPLDNAMQSNMSFGFFTRKKLYHNFFLGTGLDVSVNLKSIAINTTNNSDFSGYFSINQTPFIFQSIKGNSTLLQVPLQLYYTFEKWTPSVGISSQKIKYEALFSNTSLQENQKFIAQTYQLGYIFELSYALSNKISLFFNYQTYRSKAVTFEKDSTTQIATNSPIKYQKIQIGAYYFF